MTDETPKRKPEPLTLFPTSGKASPKSSSENPPRILPVEPLTQEQFERLMQEAYPSTSQRSDNTGNDSS